MKYTTFCGGGGKKHVFYNMTQKIQKVYLLTIHTYIYKGKSVPLQAPGTQRVPRSLGSQIT